MTIQHAVFSSFITHPKRVKHIIACVFCGVLISQPLMAGDRPIRICAAEGHVFHQMVEPTIKEAYRRLDLDVEFTWLPTKRSLIEANQGDCDGEMMRITGVDQTFENLLPIPITIAHLEGVAFAKTPLASGMPPITNWQDLRHLHPYIISGELYAEQGTHDMIVGRVETYQQLFNMLEKGHIDVGIGIRNVGLVEITRHFPNSKIGVYGSPLAYFSMYHYIHKNKRHLKDKLQAVLKAMALGGEIDRLNAHTLHMLSTQIE